MGVVYMAEQTAPVRRRVALKVIKPGMDSRQIIARFEAERQALAMMDHPNIAKVLDAGTTPEGRPYFVMELVRGISITEYCDGDRLPIETRLELFCQVCLAVQHAHQKGIIHRDLKPSNVMVTVIDGDPVPKVIDFGVAKATGQSLTDKTLFTGFAQLIGTPLYMSPEQAEFAGVDVDTRSDVYSLGVLLYELLTGTTPFDQETFRTAAYDEIRRIIREQNPPRPSTRIGTLGDTSTAVSARRQTEPMQLRRALCGELDWIVMKCLEKDRQRRYETPSRLAEDVRHRLNHEPVEAGSPSAGYRLGKFAQRNRVMLATAAMVLTALVAGTAISIWQAVRAVRAERIALTEAARATAAEKESTQERDEALVQRQRAEERFRLAFQAVHKVQHVHPNMRSVAGPEQTSKMQTAVRRDLLQFYEQMVENNEDDPRFTYEVAESCFFLACLLRFDDNERAVRLLDRALTLYERAARERPDDASVLSALANTFLFLGHWSRVHRNEPIQAEAAFRRSLEIFERAARLHPDRVGNWYLICNLGAWGYGNLLRAQGRLDEAKALDRRILALFERPGFDLNWLEKGPASRAMARDGGYDGFMALSDLLVRCGQPLKAIPILERARRRLVFNEDYRYYRGVLDNLSLSLATDPDPSARVWAVMLARENVELTPEPDSGAWRVLGLALEQTGDLQGADDAFRRVFELGDGNVNTWNGFAWQLVSDPKFSRVRPKWAVQIAERAVKLLAPGAKEAASVWNTLGVAHYRAGQWVPAIEALEKSEGLAPGEHTAHNGLFLAMALWRRGEKALAHERYGKALSTMETRPSREKAELTRFRSEAAALLQTADLDAAMPNGPDIFD